MFSFDQILSILAAIIPLTSRGLMEFLVLVQSAIQGFASTVMTP